MPRSHPDHLRYDARVPASFSYPGIHPDGRIYTCFDYSCRVMCVGHIADPDARMVIKRMLDVATDRPDQCDECPFGGCVQQHYRFQK